MKAISKVYRGEDGSMSLLMMISDAESMFKVRIIGGKLKLVPHKKGTAVGGFVKIPKELLDVFLDGLTQITDGKKELDNKS